MLIGRMVRHQIKDDLEAAFMRGFGQRIEIVHRAEQGIDAGIVRNVVPEIGHRRGKDRRQPYRVDPERSQIRQAPDDPPDVADPVAIGILKRPRVDLIENAVPPPIAVVLIHLKKSPYLWLIEATPNRARSSAGTGSRPEDSSTLPPIRLRLDLG